jgi:hypothetical protein
VSEPSPGADAAADARAVSQRKGYSVTVQTRVLVAATLATRTVLELEETAKDGVYRGHAGDHLSITKLHRSQASAAH